MDQLIRDTNLKSFARLGKQSTALASLTNLRAKLSIESTHQTLKNSQISTGLPNSKHSIKSGIIHVQYAECLCYPGQSPHCPSLENLTTHTTHSCSMEGPTWQVLEGPRPSANNWKGICLYLPTESTLPCLNNSRQCLTWPLQSKRWQTCWSWRRQRGSDADHWGHATRTPGERYMPLLITTSLSVILVAVFALLDANYHTLPSSPNICQWCFFVRETFQGHNIIIGPGTL